MDLIIVESPHKAKTIAKYLGKQYRVVASKGHVSDLPQRTLGIDVKNHYKPEYVISQEKKEVIDLLKREIAKADKVYLAADPDREGEAISWHIANVCGLHGDNQRIVFNEISKNAVIRAIEHPRNINMGLVDAQQARRVLDRLVGYELSPVISRQIKSGLSAGRVQSVALKMVVDREREIRNFKPEEYWNIFAQLTKSGKSAENKWEYYDLNGKKQKVRNADQANAVVADSKAGAWKVDQVKRAQSLSKPPAPFTTSTMQQDAISKLGFSAAMVSKVAQKLYEGVEVEGEGQIALVTYIRSDSVRVSEQAQKEALEFIAQTYGADYAPKRPNVYGTKKGAQDAHEAIRPNTLARTPESLKGKIQSSEYRLYKLIYDRFVASQMSPAIYDTLTVHAVSMSGGNAYGYQLKGKTVKFKGFTAVYSADDADAASKTLPDFTEGETLDCKDVKGEQKFTKPPLRYTDGSFIKAMEENGIGRPSTFEKTISTIAKRAYIDREGKHLYPTELGEIVCDQLVANFPDIMNSQFTATMETNLDKIEDGGVAWYDVIEDFYPAFHEQIERVRYGGKRVRPKEEVSDVTCEKCGAKMVVRESRDGKFLACPNFPKCRNTKPYGDAVSTCPKCGKPVYKKVSKKGKTFYSCSGYPECDFSSWDVPAPEFCPECGQTMRMIKYKNGSVRYECTSHECKYRREVVPPNPTATTQSQDE